MAKKVRLDLHLLTKGLVESRQKAQKLILAGQVKSLDGKILDKPGQEVAKELEVFIKSQPKFVSRGGEKLIAAFQSFPIDVKGRICLDCGISTGGFTDCLLQNGASLGFGIDVGYGQTAWSIRNDQRVILKERTNIRNLTIEKLYGHEKPLANFLVADLSFISLRLVLPVMTSLINKKNREALLLVKPQFEVGRSRVGKGGVVRNATAHIDVLEKVIASAVNQGWEPQGVLPSPVKGPAGNQEYLLWLGNKKDYKFPILENLVSNSLKN